MNVVFMQCKTKIYLGSMTKKPKCELEDEMAPARSNPLHHTGLTLIKLQTVIAIRSELNVLLSQIRVEKKISWADSDKIQTNNRGDHLIMRMHILPANMSLLSLMLLFANIPTAYARWYGDYLNQVIANLETSHMPFAKPYANGSFGSLFVTQEQQRGKLYSYISK